MNLEQRPAHNLTFTYDEIGNLVSRHRDGISSAYYFNWGKGRQLESLSYGTSAQSATTVVEHEYNSDGVRISRTFNAGGLEYIVDGDRILKQVGCGIGVLQTLEFYYDAQGEIIGFNYNGNDYYYGKNVQGDVVELYDRWSLIATYEYDAWGNLLGIKDANGNNIPDDINSTNVASINPIRYRGYYYDIEKGMYYLNSRYYWPNIGRFINADSQINTSLGFLGFNQFSYRLNTPVNMVDYGGDKPGDLFDTMDEAARDFAEYISETSIKVDREYASYIYTKTVWETKTVTYYNPNLFGNNLLSRLWNYIFRGPTGQFVIDENTFSDDMTIAQKMGVRGSFATLAALFESLGYWFTYNGSGSGTFYVTGHGTYGATVYLMDYNNECVNYYTVSCIG